MKNHFTSNLGTCAGRRKTLGKQKGNVHFGNVLHKNEENFHSTEVLPAMRMSGLTIASVVMWLDLVAHFFLVCKAGGITYQETC